MEKQFMEKQSTNFKKHKDDEFFDRIDLIEKRTGQPLIRLIVVPRYKTSGLSGDEWRISGQIQINKGSRWEHFDRHFLDLETATIGLYPAIFGHPRLHQVSIAHADFYRKGVKVYESTYDGKLLPLIHVAGHLPWAFILARENVEPGNWDEFCFQPSCSAEAVSTYQLKYEYCHRGHKTKPVTGPYHRRFCKRHLRRGNCGLEDADENYIVIEGLGPDQAEGWEEDARPAVFGGFIDLAK
jgi:hypothetical protein